MFARRRDASIASRGCGSAQFEEAFDEIDEDLEEREDRSDITEFGDATEETDRVREDRRADVGKGWGIFIEPHSQGLSLYLAISLDRI